MCPLPAAASRIDVIVPVFNEEEGLPEFIQRMSALPLDVHILFVDNASTDGSLAIMKQVRGATIIRHERNEGYGASLRDGIRAATANRVVIIDADCEYPPEAIPELIKTLDTCDLVLASRFLDPEKKPAMSWFRSFGNRFISSLFNVLFHQNITDLYTGCKAFHRSVTQDLVLQRSGFEHVLEFAVRLCRKGCVIKEVAIEYRPRHTGSSKMSHLVEIMKFFSCLFWYYLTVPKAGPQR